MPHNLQQTRMIIPQMGMNQKCRSVTRQSGVCGAKSFPSAPRRLWRVSSIEMSTKCAIGGQFVRRRTTQSCRKQLNTNRDLVGVTAQWHGLLDRENLSYLYEALVNAAFIEAWNTSATR